jgi:zinc/manganese transport system permease protein
VAAAGVIGVIGLLLLAFPAMDQPWLDWLEGAAPVVRLAFLDAAEREADEESRRAIDEGLADLARVRRIQDDVQWGRRPMSDDMRERLRQYIAGRTELVTGDRLVRRTLGQKARERQRWALGIPLTVAGAALAVFGLRDRCRTALRPGERAGERPSAGRRADR